MSIETYGTGERLQIAANLAVPISDGHLVFLPVPTTKDNTFITKTKILLKDTLQNVEKGSVVVGYELPFEYKESVTSLGADAIDLAQDEEYLCENARLTAYAALGYILTKWNKCPKETQFGIVGYGRIGSELVRLLLFLGAKIKVYTSRQDLRISLGECDVETARADWDKGEPLDFSNVEILINTAPSKMSSSFPQGFVPDGMRVIELASGENFDGVVGIERLPALPERFFPESAARAYVSAIERWLKKRGKNK